MKVEHLAEAIILQSIEDMWNEEHRDESITFFAGKDFRTCASLASIDIADQIGILKMLDKIIKDTQSQAGTRKKASYAYPLLRSNMRETARSH